MKRNRILVIKLILLFGFFANTAFAQEYKFSLKKSKDALIKVMTLATFEVEEHSGNEVIIKAIGMRDKPEKAKGLRPIYNSRVDNTGIGLYVEEIDGVAEITTLVSNNVSYIMQVPKGIAVSIKNSGHNCDKISVRNFTGEIEISAIHTDSYLQDVTGPVILNNRHGNVTVIFSQLNPDKPVSIVSSHGDLDVTLPEKTKADLSLKANHGEIYTDMEIDFNQQPNDMTRLSSYTNEINGKLNGGGAKIYLETNHSTLYLRKK